MHTLDLSLYLYLKEFLGNGVRNHVNSKGKILPTGKILPRGGLNLLRCIKQDSEPNALPTSYSCPESLEWLDRGKGGPTPCLPAFMADTLPLDYPKRTKREESSSHWPQSWTCCPPWSWALWCSQRCDRSPPSWTGPSSSAGCGPPPSALARAPPWASWSRTGGSWGTAGTSWFRWAESTHTRWPAHSSGTPATGLTVVLLRMSDFCDTGTIKMQAE